MSRYKAKYVQRLLRPLSLFLVALSVGAWIGAPWPRQGRKRTPIEAEPNALDFGEVFVTNEFHWELPLKNTSRKDVVVADILASCACTSIQPKNFTIPGKATARCNVTLDLTTKDPQTADLPVREFSVQLRPLVLERQKRSSSAVWTLRGEVRSPIRFVPTIPAFPEGALLRGDVYKPLEVEVISHKPLRSLAVASEDSEAVTACLESALDTTGAYRLTVTPSEQLALGKHVFRMTFGGETGDGEVFEGIPLSVEGTVQDDIVIVPCVVSFGAMAVGENETQTVTIQSRAGKSFEVVRTECPSEHVRTEQLRKDEKPPSTRCRVVLTASKSGAQQERLAFHVKEKGQDTPRELFVDLVYFGRPDAIDESSDVSR